jgi:hypothetical protein
MKKEKNLYQGLEILAISGDIIEALDENIFFYDKCESIISNSN